MSGVPVTPDPLIIDPDGWMMMLATDAYSVQEAEAHARESADGGFAQVVGREWMQVRELDETNEDDQQLVEEWGAATVAEPSERGHGREYWVVALDATLAGDILKRTAQAANRLAAENTSLISPQDATLLKLAQDPTATIELTPRMVQRLLQMHDAAELQRAFSEQLAASRLRQPAAETAADDIPEDAGRASTAGRGAGERLRTAATRTAERDGVHRRRDGVHRRRVPARR